MYISNIYFSQHHSVKFTLFSQLTIYNFITYLSLMEHMLFDVR